MMKLSIAVSAWACLTLFCSPLLATAAELGPSSPPTPAEAAQEVTHKPADLLDLEALSQSLVDLVENIKEAWRPKMERIKSKGLEGEAFWREARGEFWVTALNVARDLNRRLRAQQVRASSELAKLNKFSLAKAISDGAKNVGNYINELKDDAKKEIFVDPNDPDSSVHDWLLTAANIAPESAGAGAGEGDIAPATIEADDESIDLPGYPKPPSDRELAKTKTYEEYCAYVEKHNKELADRSIEGIKNAATELVHSLFYDQLRQLALVMLTLLLTGNPITGYEVKAQLLRQIRLKMVKFVCQAFGYGLMVMFERLSPKDHPHAPKLEFDVKNLVDWARKHFNDDY